MNYHYVYKITIIETGQYYIGVRSCNVLPENDPYLGSGTIIRAFHKKLPRSAFKKEILQTFSDRDAANAHEKYLISLEDLTSAMVLNSFGRRTKKVKEKTPCRGRQSGECTRGPSGRPVGRPRGYVKPDALSKADSIKGRQLRQRIKEPEKYGFTKKDVLAITMCKNTRELMQLPIWNELSKSGVKIKRKGK